MKNYKYSEITPENIYDKRRNFIKSFGLGLGSLTLGSMSLLNCPTSILLIILLIYYYLNII